MAALCEIYSCGVLAIGRCADCARAFCASHRSQYLTDLCVICQARRDIDMTSSRAASRNFLMREAVGELRASVAPMEIHTLKTEVEFKGRFGRAEVFEWKGYREQWPDYTGDGHRFRETVMWSGWAWLIGKFDWRHEAYTRNGPTQIHFRWPTAIVADTARFESSAGLVRVRWDLRRRGLWIHGSDGVFVEGYGQAAAAVRRIIWQATSSTADDPTEDRVYPPFIG